MLQAAGSVLAAEATSRARPNVRLIGLLALGHLVIDLNQGALSGLLPFLKAEHGLSYAQAAMIVLMTNLTSSTVALWISALMPLAGFAAARSLPAPRGALAQ